MKTTDSIQEFTLPKWLKWAREIQAISQTGLHYAENNYQKQRYARLSEISAEIISEYAEVEYEELNNIFTRQIGYATPRIDVRGAVFRAGNLLLVREIFDGGWTMPGGWVDVGDTPSGAVERDATKAGFNGFSGYMGKRTHPIVRVAGR